MNKFHVALLSAAAMFTALPASSQVAAPAIPGMPDTARVKAGNYTVDSRHTQIVWKMNHLGFSMFHGNIGDPTGTMKLDPANPGAAFVSIDIPMINLVTTSAALTNHMQTADFFDTANHPTATFRSTKVEVKGTTAKITGNLTIRGITKPVVLDTKLIGAGVNPRGGKENVGFSATTSIKRSDFGSKYSLPALSDKVDLEINAAFERAS